MTAETETNKAVVARHYAILVGGDPADWDEIMAEDFVPHHPHASGKGRARYRDAAATHSTVFSDFVPEVRRMVAEDDCVVAHFIVRGRHTGDFLGFPATRREFSFSGIAIDRLANGQLAEAGTQRTRLDGSNSLVYCQPTSARSGGSGSDDPLAPQRRTTAPSVLEVAVNRTRIRHRGCRWIYSSKQYALEVNAAIGEDFSVRAG